MKRLYCHLLAIAAAACSMVSTGCGRGESDPPDPKPGNPEIRWQGQDSGYRNASVPQSGHKPTSPPSS